MYKCSLCPNIKPWPTVHKAERHRITHIPLAFRKMFQCPQCKERFIKVIVTVSVCPKVIITVSLCPRVIMTSCCTSSRVNSP